jgi:hypothetical protein
MRQRLEGRLMGGANSSVSLLDWPLGYMPNTYQSEARYRFVFGFAMDGVDVQARRNGVVDGRRIFME